ncbi:hypothetical protein ACXYTJ_08680 [Gilvimarinus sp. F26214L]|uniref:hypothetical protein n=1 Tax=Gilvimarinus sp. DZF01 TaxID=3461371 RepID=UPI0040460220
MADNRHFLTFSRPLLGLCAGILLATFVSAAICQHLIATSLENRSSQYGQALANVAARQAIDSTLNHDLVSLQVILSDIAENPDVATVTIHDVENNLLVQASGPMEGGREESSQRANFTAPITLHNSIAGHVTVGLDLSTLAQVETQLYWLFGFMAALLIALTLSALYFGRSWNVPATLPRPTIPIVNAPPQPEPQESEPAPARRAFPRVELIVQFHNLRELSTQLDNRAFRQVSRRLEEQFKGVLALYAGQLIQLDANQARIAFPNPEDEQDSPFHALCSAKLLLTLNRPDSQFPLQSSALVVLRDSDSSILKNLQYQLAESDEYNQLLANAPDGALLMESRLVDEPLAARVDQEPIDEFQDLVEIVSLGEQYEQLLERQLTRLQRA